MLSETLVVLDFETTGLSPRAGDRVTEVAAIRIRDNRIVDQFESLVNCGKRLDPYIVSYTGITQKMVDGAPPPKKVVRELIKFLGGSSVVAHNSWFDEQFFLSECRHVGIEESTNPFICSMRLARRVYPRLGSYSLGSIASSIGLSYSGSAHRAAADARLTANLLLKMTQAIRERCVNLRIDTGLLRKITEMPTARAMEKLVRLAQ